MRNTKPKPLTTPSDFTKPLVTLRDTTRAKVSRKRFNQAVNSFACKLAVQIMEAGN